ncbi:MAG: archease [Planctomycetia bacterium]|jgi:SHS2 domain-containing protein
MYAVFEHTADLGIKVSAPTLDMLLADAARGLTAVIGGGALDIEPRQEDTFHVTGTDPVWLLADWVGEVLAAFDTRRMLYRDFVVVVGPTGLEARARGEPYDPVRHVLAHEVKAVTQHLLDVHRTADGWQATFVVDI